MEYIVGIAVVAAIIYLLSTNKKKEAVVEAQPEAAPYKVEAPVVEAAPVAEAKPAKAKKAPAKKPAAIKAPAKAKTTAKKAAPKAKKPKA